MTQQQRRVRFGGNVQGVGFRYTTCRVAGDFDVVGYVRNLPDGTVELLAEGEPEEIDRFLDALSSQMRSYIRTTDQQTAAPEGCYPDFGVQF